MTNAAQFGQRSRLDWLVSPSLMADDLQKHLAKAQNRLRKVSEGPGQPEVDQKVKQEAASPSESSGCGVTFTKLTLIGLIPQAVLWHTLQENPAFTNILG